MGPSRGAQLTALRFTVIGSAGTHPSRDRVCSSYLVVAEGYRLLLDLGHGALHNLLKVLDPTELDAVLISHLHVDHFADLYGLNYALRFHPSGAARVAVYAPAGARDHIGQLLPDESLERLALDFHEAAAGDALRLGPFEVALHAANHPVETLAARISVDGTVVAYSGDTAPAAGVVDAARGADLFVCDSTWREGDRPLPDGVHCTGREAGAMAAEARVRTLLVTHVSPYHDPAAVAADAADVFDGDVRVATDLLEIAL